MNILTIVTSNIFYVKFAVIRPPSVYRAWRQVVANIDLREVIEKWEEGGVLVQYYKAY